MAAASWLSFFGCAVFSAVVAFFAVAVLAAGVVRVVFLDVVAGFCLLRVAMFVFPFVLGFALFRVGHGGQRDHTVTSGSETHPAMYSSNSKNFFGRS